MTKVIRLRLVMNHSKHRPRLEGDPLLPKPVRAGLSPATKANGARGGRRGVVRGYPLGTDVDSCEWHACGMAVEDDVGIRSRRWLNPNRRVRLVLGDHRLVSKSLEGSRQPGGDLHPPLGLIHARGSDVVHITAKSKSPKRIIAQRPSLGLQARWPALSVGSLDYTVVLTPVCQDLCG
jgi:hypothetical protein